MSPTKKIILLFSLYLVTGIIILLASRADERNYPAGTSSLLKIPTEIVIWKSEDIILKDANDFFILTNTSSFNYLLRKYKKNESGPEILLSALEDLKGTQRDIHDPRLCYESRGWTVLSYNNGIIGSGEHDFGKMKVISYTNKDYDIKRYEIFGYVSNGKLITKEISLRLVHIRNRIIKIFGGSPDNIIYLNLSADLKHEDSDAILKDFKYLMGEIISILMVDKA